MNKRAFLVLGPESSGTRLMTRLLMNAGCYGDDDHDQRLDELIPEGESLIAWRRSVPHRGEWVNPLLLIDGLRDQGFEVFVIIMSRDWHSMAISQQQWHTNGDVHTALGNIQRAYRDIFTYVSDSSYRGWQEPPYEIVNYEALVLRPAGTVRYLFRRLGLPVPVLIPEIFDGNAKYYPALEMA